MQGTLNTLVTVDRPHREKTQSKCIVPFCSCSIAPDFGDSALNKRICHTVDFYYRFVRIALVHFVDSYL